jgi:hypothetical protein
MHQLASETPSPPPEVLQRAEAHQLGLWVTGTPLKRGGSGCLIVMVAGFFTIIVTFMDVMFFLTFLPIMLGRSAEGSSQVPFYNTRLRKPLSFKQGMNERSFAGTPGGGNC